MLFLIGCQTVKVKTEQYEVIPRTIELGSVGKEKSLLNLQNDFIVRTLPKLDHEIRLAIEIIPFNKKLAKLYETKAKYNQAQLSINYNDSVALKPELATIKILDILGVVQELNAPYNKDLFELLYKNKLEFVSSVAIVLPTEDLAKIREADAYYLNNEQQKKYTISLMKQGKRIGILDLRTGTIIAHKVSKFCWTEDSKGKWHIADISENRCPGIMKSRPKKVKSSKNLYKL